MQTFYYVLAFAMVALAAPVVTHISEVVIVLGTTQEVLSTMTASPLINNLEARKFKYFDPADIPGEEAAISANDWIAYPVTHTEPPSSTPPYRSSYLYGPLPFTIKSTKTVEQESLAHMTKVPFTVRSSKVSTKPPKDRATVTRTAPYAISMLGEFGTTSLPPLRVLLSWSGAEPDYIETEAPLVPVKASPTSARSTQSETYMRPFKPQVTTIPPVTSTAKSMAAPLVDRAEALLDNGGLGSLDDRALAPLINYLLHMNDKHPDPTEPS
ncbi:hypothetical protein AMS68_007233 [Peltaster fructicola]|uniref:Yeast cell wall synthesis Kre9/Knh1 C-terminal domain-containing protein n=1 Tax=Peltaster fructicola TaxID=286661 RepID=A0A6H0Y431_9PEZI|nr:hypothetical protein AMS68_007233 [Peltaster fructicola]